MSCGGEFELASFAAFSLSGAIRGASFAARSFKTFASSRSTRLFHRVVVRAGARRATARRRCWRRRGRCPRWQNLDRRPSWIIRLRERHAGNRDRGEQEPESKVRMVYLQLTVDVRCTPRIDDPDVEASDVDRPQDADHLRASLHRRPDVPGSRS